MNFKRMLLLLMVTLIGFPIASVNAVDSNFTILSGHEERVSHLAFSPDGQLFASTDWAGDNSPGQIKIWNTATGQLKRCIDHHAWSVAFSPDGSILATGYRDEITLWDPNTGGVLRRLKGHQRDKLICSLSFRKDGKELVSGSSDNTIKVWNIEDEVEVCRKTLVRHTDGVESVAYLDETHLISGSADKSIKVWDITTGKAKTAPAHYKGVNSIAVSPDKTQFASASNDGMIRIWDARIGGVQKTLISWNQPYGVTCVAYHPDGNLLASQGHGNINLWDLRTGKIKSTFYGTNGHSIAFNREGNKLISCYSSDLEKYLPQFRPHLDTHNRIALWDLETILQEVS